ncbi:MAG: hypothetical protein LBS55_14445 [Prevotellaceae bacterium]|jgi:transposase-like protein|nr:hypothetical protein [Prevotellaceae bacterium]
MIGRPSKYRKAIADRICEMIRSDTYTIREICETVNINTDTYHSWKRTFSDFSDAIKAAQNDRDLKFVAEAKKSLLKKLTGYEAQEEKTVYVTGKDGQRVAKGWTETTKHIQPDTVAIIFTLCNKDGWTNKYAAELTGKDGKDLHPEPITVEIIDSREQVIKRSI